MITKFKIFENNEYKLGDYVKTYIDINPTQLVRYDKYFKIINIDKNKYIAKNLYGTIYQLKDVDIERKMTTKEIENFELFKNKVEYNL